MKNNASIIKKTVLQMGGTIDDFMPELGYFHINIFNKRILFENRVSITRNFFATKDLTKCKDITYKLLTFYNFSTPNTESFYHNHFNQKEFINKLDSLNYPVILKDSRGSNSLGIFPFIKNRQEGLKILKKELPYFKSMIAQEMVFGKEYRVLVLEEKVIAALQMISPNITGDGVNTIRSIIQKKQQTTKRKTKFDKKFIQILQDQKVKLSTILANKKIIYIKKNSCLAEGGETRDVTDLVNNEIKKICVSASKIVGKNLVGIDIICKDISRIPTKKTFYILEMNSNPDLGIHYNPTYGKTREVAKDIVKFMAKIAI